LGQVPARDIVTIGGSAGSISVLEEIIAALPANLEACLIIVVHLAPRDRNVLPEIFANKSRLPVMQALNGDRIQPGRIYTAPPDRHLLIADDHIHLARGPKEGLHRPSINVTFRSVAARYGPRVVGVLLSGMLDDGAAGLWEIGNRGGITIVQNPREAQYPSMPLNALQDAIVNYQLNGSEIGPLIGRIVRGEEAPQTARASGEENVTDAFSGFRCPECDGPLFELRKPGPIEFRCRVGHLMPLKTLLHEGTSNQERRLYQAMLALLEGADLAEFAANRAAEIDREALRGEAAQLRGHAETIRRLIEERGEPTPD